MKPATDIRREAVIDAMIDKIHQIGLARFAGRVQSGVVASDEGYEAIDRFVEDEKRRPLLSRLGQALTGRTDIYQKP